MNDRIEQARSVQSRTVAWVALTLGACALVWQANAAVAQDAYKPSYAFPPPRVRSGPRRVSVSPFSPAYRSRLHYSGTILVGQPVPSRPAAAGVPGPILLAPGEEIIISPEGLPQEVFPREDFSVEPPPVQFPQEIPPVEQQPPVFLPRGPRPGLPVLRPVPYRVERVAPPIELPSPDASPLQVFVTEGFLGQLLGGEKTTTGEVNDFILKAQVTGTQTTVTRVSADFRPNENVAEIVLQLDGECHSETIGARKVARIATEGRHTFQGTKEITFDGSLLKTRVAQVRVQPFNRTLGAETNLDGVPMLNDFARQIAYQQAERLRPKSEAIAAEKLGTRTAREFNEAVDQQLATANKALLKRAETGAADPLSALWPETLRFSTTDTQLICRANWPRLPTPAVPSANLVSFAPAGETTVAQADVPAPLEQRATARIAPSADSATVYVHDSLLNAGIGRTGLAGGGFTEETLIAMTEGLATRLGGRVVPPQGEPPVENPLSAAFEATLRLDGKTPLQIQFANDQMTATIRASIEVGGKQVITSRDIVIPFVLKFEEDRLRLIPGKVNVAATNPESIDLPGLGNNLLESRIQAAVSELEFPRSVPLPLAALADRSLRVEQVRADGGWLMLNLVWGVAQPN